MINNNSAADNCYCLSPQQARAVAIRQYAQQQYLNVHGCWRIHTVIDVDRLNHVLKNVCQRYEVLRTNYVRPAGFREPVQVIRDEVAIELTEVPAEQASAQLAQQVDQPFVLDSGVMLRVSLCQHQKYCDIQLVAPALALDVSGLNILFQTISEQYHGNVEIDKEEIIQAVDVANWLNELHQSDEFVEEQTYWRQQGQGTVFGCIKLADSETSSGCRAQLLRRFDDLVAVKVLGAEYDLSAETVLFTLWQVVLGSYIGWSQLTVALAVENRDDEMDGFVGLLCSYLPVVVDYADEPQGPALLSLLKDNQQRIARHRSFREHFNWRNISDEQQPYLSRYGFSFNEQPDISFAGVATTELISSAGVTDWFDLQLSCQLGKTSVALNFDYDSAVFSAETVALISDRFEQLLNQAFKVIATAPQTPVAALDSVSELEKQLLAGSGPSNNAKIASESNAKSAAELFARFADQHRHKIAVATEQGNFNYGEIDQRAEQLAGYLQAQGIGVQTPVAVCTGRDEHLIISLLAIMKVGAVYIPLDPELQSQRIRYIIEDTGCQWVLTVAQQQAIVSDLATLIRVDQPLDTEQPFIPVTVDSDCLAYLIYTSGSTGKPKGVGISHHALFHYVTAVHERLQLSVDGSLLALASVTTDLGHTALFGALLSGRSLRLLQADKAMQPDALAQHLADNPVSCLKIVPSHLKALLSIEDPARILPTECLVFGGEELPASLIEQVRQLQPGLRIVNHYGPTETTVGVITHEVSDNHHGGCPIGRALNGAEAFVVNACGQLAGVGVVGELYLGGETLAQGYWQRADLTAERFVPDAFSGKQGRRLYRTGDLAWYRADGELVYVGRCDHQVKVRGFRVELGEIEFALCQHPHINEAVALMQTQVGGEDSSAELVAHIVLNEVQTLDVAAIKAFVDNSLPDYMVPVAMQPIRSLPLTRSGKVDRKALPLIERQSKAARAGYKAPTTLKEIRLAELWQDLLGVERIGIDDNFFALGGQSLLAIRLVASIRKEFGREISVREVFDYPTITLLLEVLQGSAENHLPELVPQDRSELVPLSFAQQRLWFIEQLQGAGSQYNMPFVMRITGQINVTHLEKALTAIVERHEVLRTSYVKVTEHPEQLIHGRVDFKVTRIELASLDSVAREVSVQKILKTEASTPFELTEVPMLRACLLCCGANEAGVDEYVLSLTMHHIASDGTSLAVLMQELGTLMAGLAEGQDIASILPPLDIQYADYALWQRNWLTGTVLENQLAYWSEQLSDLPAAHSLPLDRPRTVITHRPGEHVDVWIKAETLQQLKQLAQQQDVTLFMLLHGALSLLLARHSGERDIVMGTPVANRMHPAVEPLIGFFVNTLVLRLDVDLQLSLSDYLAAVKNVNLGAQAHQDTPFELLVEQLNPQRSQLHTPLFQIMMNFLHIEQDQGAEQGGLSFEPLSADDGVTKFELTVTLAELAQSERLQIRFEYATDIFDRSTIADMAQRFSVLLHALVAYTQPATLAGYQILSADERDYLVSEVNQTEHHYPQDRLVHQMFADQAAVTPDHLAVVTPTQQLTYQELNQRANQLAHYLIAQGVKPNTLVGLCMDRSTELLIGILAILKAGGAYVPMDPSYPEDRLSYMREDAGLKLVVTHQGLTYVLPEGGAEVICVDDHSQFKEQPLTNPEVPELGMDNLSYVIYTSGSTGRPKGTLIGHDGVSNLLQWYNRRYAISADDRLLVISATGFDLTQKNLLAPLLLGASVHFATATDYDPQRIVATVEANQVTLLNCASSAFYPLIETAAEQNYSPLRSLRVVLIGGEIIMMSRLKAWLKTSETQLIHQYGPTEGTDIASAYEVVDDWQKYQVLPIGTPNDNVKLYLLDRAYGVIDNEANLVPRGAVGELYIGGVGVAKGYHNQPELTRRRFIVDPFSTTPLSNGEPARLYRTGDLARYLADGNLEFVGRVDEQVKIRGFRIETSEIEQQILSSELVASTLVLVREDEPGNKTLVAYVIAAHDEEQPHVGDEQQLVQQLGKQLQQALPEYMVPSVFAVLDAWPLTANGKVDKKALPRPNILAVALEYLAPSNALEQSLVDIFAALLHLPADKLSVNANFFAVGGHSLLATRVVANIHHQCQLDASVRDIFEHPTIAELAEALSEKPVLALPPLVEQPRDGDIPLSFAQQRLWFIEQLQGASGLYNMPFATRIIGPLDSDVVVQALEAIFQRHEVLRTTYESVNDEPVQRIHTDMALPLIREDLRGMADSSHHIQEALNDEASAPFDLSSDAMFRGRLLHSGDEEHVLLLTMHHIASDGVSMGVLMNEFGQLIAGLSTGVDVAQILEPLPIQYADYALWQRDWLSGEVLKRQIDYWRRQLEDLPQTHSLALDRPRPALMDHSGGHVDVWLDGDCLKGLTGGDTR
ncbi:amino acid adenylation domain-containing protein [Microbulbifer sp. 2304DJ12-6]|uniref:amino acid adenylation domain-containing protein n=1 Tax=Microbulbifer sp. 2304DJ12-6 TaxID=3233340 RepID=UPI0039B0B398